jgi:hypothetical protein
LGRGLGPIQQAIIAALRRYTTFDAVQLACVVYGESDEHDLTRAQINTVHHAVKALAKRKLIKRRAGEMSLRGNPIWILAVPIRLNEAPKSHPRLRSVKS